jgi:hypothetical protein
MIGEKFDQPTFDIGADRVGSGAELLVLLANSSAIGHSAMTTAGRGAPHRLTGENRPRSHR